MKRLVIFIMFFLSFIVMVPISSADDLLWISVENKPNGLIKASLTGGRSWVTLGKVIRAGKGVAKAFPAVKWGKDGTVVAMSSYAIHIRVNEKEVFSIVSKEMMNIPPGFGGYMPGEAGIVTDINAGTLLFKDISPLLGSKVYLKLGNELQELPQSYSLEGNEELFIIVEERELPQGIVIENKKNGNAYVIKEGKRTPFAKVEKALTAIGRFDGTEFTGLGRINTVHPGAITVSTVFADGERFDSKLSGGFQILPIENTVEEYFSTASPYLIIAPLADSLAGQYPLFDGTIGIWDFEGKGYKVEASWDNIKWEEIPILRGKIDDLTTYLEKTFKGKYKGTMSLIRIVCPQVSVRNGMKEILKENISKVARIVRGELEVEIRLKGEGAKIVDLKIDGKLRAVKNFPPYIFSVDTRGLVDGEHIIEVSAKDENGDVLASQTQKIYVDNQGIFKE